MRQHKLGWLLSIGAGLSCLFAASSVFSAISEARLVGFAMHQETGRNIYIGAIHYDELVPLPEDLLGAAGPRVMEYRVVARRTSIRSIMGSILLQGELATGTPPSAGTINFAGDIMAAVQGSLYAGDSLQIRLNKDDSIVAALDGLELARTDEREVADYLLMGWIGEGGPSTAFRSSILASDLDSTLMSIYSAHVVSNERLAVIDSWAAPAEEPVAEPEPELEIVAAIAVAAATPPEPTPVLQNQSTEPVLVASLTPTLEMIQSTDEDALAADMIDAMEYAQRLANFNTLVLRAVYAQIRYPRAAVRRNIQGTLELDLIVDINGSLQKIAVARSSGYSMLDKSAIKAAEKAFSEAPLPDIDQVAVAEYSENGNQLIIPIPISFILTE